MAAANEFSAARQEASIASGQSDLSLCLADDLLNGVNEIAEFLGQKPRRVLYLVEQEQIPFFRLGKRIHARKSELAAVFSAAGAGQK